MKRVSILLLATLFAAGLWAVPAIPYPIDITLADGTTTQVYLRGDEFAHHYTLLDGTPVRLEQGKLIVDHTLPEITRQKMRMARQTTIQASDFPNVGSPRGLVILVNFVDKKFIKTNAEFKAMLNEAGYDKNGGIGSARDYFIGASDSLFQPIFDVYGPYDLPQNMAYYGAPSGGGSDSRPDEMIMHACAVAEENGVDFSLYDENNDGKIDNVFVYYAGNNQAEGGGENTVWPHRGYVSLRPQYGGKTLYDYACSSELRLTGKKMCGIGTFCHEFSHVLGLADLYDTQGDNITVDYWDLMASGSYNGGGCQPPSYTAFERFSVGWLTPTVLTDPGQYLLEPLTTHNQAYLIPVGDKKIEPNENGEYFLLENRQEVGWDAGPACLRGTGMLIWHINYKSAYWASNTPNAGSNLLCFIESATGAKRTEGGPMDTYPGIGRKTLFQPTSVAGVSLEKPLLDIKQLDKTISFVFIRDGNKHLAFSQDEVVQLESSYTQMADTLLEDIAVQKLMLVGASLDPNATVQLKSSNLRFQISVDSIDWQKILKLTPTPDSVLSVPIYVRYNAQQQVCDWENAHVQAQQGAAFAVLELQGKAPRETLITPPEAETPIDATPYSAELTWKAVEDATHYYVTLYQIHQGETQYTESFEEFESPSAVAKAGWQSNFNTLSSILKASGNYSLWFKTTGDQVVSEEYLQPVKDLSFWYSVPTTNVDTVGGLLIEGFDGEIWSTIDSLTIKKRDRKQTYQATLSSNSYIQFRITFAGNEGGEGVCVDNYVAVCGTYIDYLYQGDELTIEAVDGENTVTCYVTGLEPNEEYFYKLRVSDKGREGCEEHVKEMVEAQMFRTLNGYNEERDLTAGIDSIHYSQPEHVIYVPEAKGDRTLYFYDMLGQLIGQVAVAEHQNRVPFPEGNFIPGNVYIVKYAVTDKLKRKDRRIKIIY